MKNIYHHTWHLVTAQSSLDIITALLHVGFMQQETWFDPQYKVYIVLQQGIKSMFEEHHSAPIQNIYFVS